MGGTNSKGGAYLKGRLFRLSIFSLKMTLSLFLFKTKLQPKNSKTLLIENYFLRTRNVLKTFSSKWGERLFEGGHLLQPLNLKRGANLKWGAYLKLAANLSIYGD